MYLVIGIWHEASFKYIAFGLWNGTLITLSLLLDPLFIKLKQKLHIDDKNKWFNMFRMIRTAALVLIGRYITRAANLGTTFAMLNKTFTNFKASELTNGTLLNLGLTTGDFVIVGFSVMLLLFIEGLQEHNVDVTKKLKEKNIVLQYAILTSFLVIIAAFGIYRGDYIASEFIYKQF